ncbi:MULTISPECIES: hypothetical protein [Roseomonadaceae]|uniref:Uncharacterized protein n=1 Tax=Falsiroseomonas oleicola TaxID=2801474 RepID=A0ABS6HAU5_9PROT|nr:hypothetical protein [Roseomonas oleicola]MBU8545808.1 hypothetical protein [Roseomonas oleicola]
MAHPIAVAAAQALADLHQGPAAMAAHQALRRDLRAQMPALQAAGPQPQPIPRRLVDRHPLGPGIAGRRQGGGDIQRPRPGAAAAAQAGDQAPQHLIPMLAPEQVADPQILLPPAGAGQHQRRILGMPKR